MGVKSKLRFVILVCFYFPPHTDGPYISTSFFGLPRTGWVAWASGRVWDGAHSQTIAWVGTAVHGWWYPAHRQVFYHRICELKCVANNKQR